MLKLAIWSCWTENSSQDYKDSVYEAIVTGWDCGGRSNASSAPSSCFVFTFEAIKNALARGEVCCGFRSCYSAQTIKCQICI